MNTDSPIQNPGIPEPQHCPTGAAEANPGRLMATCLQLPVRLYRNTLGIVLPNSCRYQPTCSQYALDALTEYGAVRGTWLAVKRIARCHPLAAGGYDPVPTKGPRTKDKGHNPDLATERRTTTA